MSEPGFDGVDFDSCVERHQTDELVHMDIAAGRLVGVHATPTLFINGTKVEGLKAVERLRQLLESREGEDTPLRAETATGSGER